MRGPVVSGRWITLTFHRPARRAGAQRRNDAARAACSSVRWLTGNASAAERTDAGRHCEEFVRERLVEDDLGHLEPADRLAADARLEAEDHAALAVDGEPQVVGAVGKQLDGRGAARPWLARHLERRTSGDRRLSHDPEVESG